MSLSESEIQQYEERLGAGANSTLNTLGPMALPMLFILWDLSTWFVGGIIANIIWNYNPPLISGWNISILNPIVYGALEIWYLIHHWQIGLRAKWLELRYWFKTKPGHYFSDDFKIDHWQFLGRAIPTKLDYVETEEERVYNETDKDGKPFQVKRKEKVKTLKEVANFERLGVPTVDYGFINKPHLYMKRPDIVCDKPHYATDLTGLNPEGETVCTDEKHFVDIAGDRIYEVHMRSKKMPVAIVCLPDLPDRMIRYEGNFGVIVQGGLLFDVENISVASFVACDFTKSELVPFIPVCVISDCAQMAESIILQRAIMYAGPKAVEVAAKTRDTFHNSDTFRQLKDSEKELEIQSKQVGDIQTMVDRQATAQAKSTFKIQAGIKHAETQGQKRASSRWLPWIGVAIFIGVIVALLRFG